MTTDGPTGLGYGERVAIARLRALLELLPPALDRRLHGFRLTAFEYTLLESLSEAPDHRLRLSALASRTNATLPRLSRVVSGLERRGLVTKEQCAADARATNAVLTDSGAEAFRRAAPAYGDAVRDLVLGGLDGADVEDLARLCLEVLRRLDPDGRLAVTLGEECGSDPSPEPSPESTTGQSCGADPSPSAGQDCGADPSGRSVVSPADEAQTPCGADPVVSGPGSCGADPEPSPTTSCGADPEAAGQDGA